MDRATGALVAEITSDGPAAAAGILEGDIIIEFDGREIDLSSQLPHFVGQTRVGEKVDVVVIRDTRRERRVALDSTGSSGGSRRTPTARS